MELCCQVIPSKKVKTLGSQYQISHTAFIRIIALYATSLSFKVCD